MIPNSDVDNLLALSGTAFVAAGLNLTALLPDIITARDPEKAAAMSVKRPTLQAAANVTWALHGVVARDIQLTAVTITAVLLLAALLRMILRARRQ